MQLLQVFASINALPDGHQAFLISAQKFPDALIRVKRNSAVRYENYPGRINGSSYCATVTLFAALVLCPFTALCDGAIRASSP